MITNWITCVRHHQANLYIVYLKRLNGDIAISFFLDSDLESKVGTYE